MRAFISIIVLSISLNAKAFFFIEIVNPCVNVPSIYEGVDMFLPAKVSEVVKFFFNAFEIPYEATETSIVHIFHTPTGEDAMEIVDAKNSHYRYYGWCYELDGIIPDVTMDKVIVDPIHSKHLRWFYGYAETKNGVWLNYCEPLYNHPEQFICGD